jgi:hypothetical protein
MKRIGIVGLCTVAMVALSAMVASTAQATAVEYGKCVKQLRAKYEYENSTCTLLALKNGKPDKKGLYQWEPGPSPNCINVGKKKGRYRDSKCQEKDEKNGLPAGDWEFASCASNPNEGCPGWLFVNGPTTILMEKPLNREVHCNSSGDVGRITGPKTAEERFEFFECETEGKLCYNLFREEKHVIVTYEVKSALLEPKLGEVWTELSSIEHEEGYPYSLLFDCAEVGFFRIKGSMSGGTTFPVNMMGYAGGTNFGMGTGEEKLKAEYSEVLEPASWGEKGPAEAKEILAGEGTFNSEIEIKSP